MTPSCDQAKKMAWGEEPEFFGPRHYFRESMIIRNLKKRVPGQSRVLDAGSGNGSLTIRIGQAGYRVLGIDASDAFIAYARDKAEQARLSGTVTFQRGDILHSNLENETFEAVVSGEVLEHLEKDDLAVREFYRVLRQGGYCIVTVPAHPKLWDKNDEWAGHFRRYTEDGLRDLFVRAGFAIEQCHHWGFPLIRLFHQAVYLPMVNRKIISQGGNISGKQGIVYRILKNQRLHRLGAWIFSFDNLFNAFPWGIGLLLVARKG